MLDTIKQQLPDDVSAPAFTDNVLPFMIDCQARSIKTALVTFVAREGAAPRPVGAQMAIAEDGRSVGYIAADCLGDAIKVEALSVLQQSGFSLIRFGKGSKYIDLKMPCGSGIDLYFDANIGAEILNEVEQMVAGRRAFTLEMNIETGVTKLAPYKTGVKNGFLDGDDAVFQRPYFPRLRIFLAGSGPSLHYMATLARLAQFDVRVVTSDEDATHALAASGIETETLQRSGTLIDEFADPFTAGVLMFHEHALEQDILAALLAKDNFYIGAMGSKTVQAARLAELAARGFSAQDLSRIHGPIGSPKGSKNPMQIAVSAFAEILQHAQQLEYIC